MCLPIRVGLFEHCSMMFDVTQGAQKRQTMFQFVRVGLLLRFSVDDLDHNGSVEKNTG